MAPSVLRAFAGATPLDLDIASHEIPPHPAWLLGCVRCLRWYRRVRPAWVGRRCVFDPSCSRYAELALRKRGLVRGLAAVLLRLHRCKPGHGGMDLP
ncbi:MAG: membrane protein insertion efficiency factor YidD [Gemmatimonadetes bacterium]|nr:membrane protein insertion efficiency factor YidD [Gemmatimonadota bacterium]